MDIKEALEKLLVAARPFTSDGVIMETTGTIPLIETLEDAIEDAENVLGQRHTTYEESL